MKTVKDKKKFGLNKKPKNKSTRKGYQFDKEQRKKRRKIMKQLKHKCFFNIPWTEEEKDMYTNLRF
jgi:hypothetical protein